MADEKTFQVVETSPIYRTIEIERAAADSTARTVPVSFASETPIWEESVGAMVILDHSPGSADFSRMEGGPVFLQHNDKGDTIAVAEGCVIRSDKKSAANLRFSKSASASEIFQDVVDGIRKQVSVRADLNKLVLEKVVDGVKVLRALKWTPKEISFVGLAADQTVGVMRGEGDPKVKTEMEIIRSEPETKQSLPQKIMETDPKVIETARAEALGGERKRITDISTSVETLAKTYPEAVETFRSLEGKAIREGTSLAEFNQQLLATLPGVRKVQREEAPVIGLTEKETKRFSVTRALAALASKDWSGAGFELECSRAVEKIAGAPKNGGFYVPYEVQAAKPEVKRDQTVASSSGGGYLVQTANMAGSFIELLRNRTVVAQLGARFMSGLRDNVTIPKLSTGSTGYWLSSESTAITESTLAFGQLALTPKTVGGYVEISRLTMLQSNPAVDGIVMDDLAQMIARAVDLGAINGSGSSGQPTGVIGTSGVGSVTGTSIAYAGMLEFQTDCASANALSVNSAYITTPVVAALLAARQRFSSTDTPLWKGSILDAEVCGFRGMASLQVPTGDIIFGDWSQVIIGEWGILELAVNPYADFTKGIIGVRAFQTVDVGVRQAGAFSVATSVT